MSKEDSLDITDLDDRTRQTIHELQDTITARYPTTSFGLERSPEDPASIHLLAVADVDDLDEVGDLVVERVVALQVDEGISLHVIPLRTPEREQEALAAARRGAVPRPTRAVRLPGKTA